MSASHPCELERAEAAKNPVAAERAVVEVNTVPNERAAYGSNPPCRSEPRPLRTP